MEETKVIEFDVAKSISLKPNSSTDKLYWLDETKKRCDHVNILVDPEMAYIECRECGEHLDPVQYLYKLACAERLMTFRAQDMRNYENSIEKKNRCKCEKCGEMTRIVR
jgi:hypothetical protein